MRPATPIDGMFRIPLLKQDLLISRESFFLGVAFGVLLAMSFGKD